MPLVHDINGLIVGTYNTGFADYLAIVASGSVDTTGWTHPRLSPRFYATPPANGIWEFDFIADMPIGMVGSMSLPAMAAGFYEKPSWTTGVTVYSATNSQTQNLSAPVAAQQVAYVSPIVVQGANALVQMGLATYDDSFQPTGTIHWHGWIPHAEMKKLRHELVLTVEGPTESQIRTCIQQATAAGLIAGIIAACGTLGAALPAAISAFISYLESCLGNSFSVRVDDHSHWIYWDT